MLMQGRFCAIFPEVLFSPLEARETVLPCSTWVGSTVVSVPWRKMHPEPAGTGWWCSPWQMQSPGGVLVFWGNHLGMKWELCSGCAGKCCITHRSSISKVCTPLHPKWPFQGHHIVTYSAFTERPWGWGLLISSVPFFADSSPLSAPCEQTTLNIQTPNEHSSPSLVMEVISRMNKSRLNSMYSLFIPHFTN